VSVGFGTSSGVRAGFCARRWLVIRFSGFSCVSMREVGLRVQFSVPCLVGGAVLFGWERVFVLDRIGEQRYSGCFRWMAWFSCIDVVINPPPSLWKAVFGLLFLIGVGFLLNWDIFYLLII